MIYTHIGEAAYIYQAAEMKNAGNFWMCPVCGFAFENTNVCKLVTPLPSASPHLIGELEGIIKDKLERSDAE